MLITFFCVGVATGVFFRPLITGILMALKLVIIPRLTYTEKLSRQRFANKLEIDRIAREADSISPNLAAELRIMAMRD